MGWGGLSTHFFVGCHGTFKGVPELYELLAFVLLALLDFIHLWHQACHKVLEMGQRLQALLEKATRTHTHTHTHIYKCTGKHKEYTEASGILPQNKNLNTNAGISIDKIHSVMNRKWSNILVQVDVFKDAQLTFALPGAVLAGKGQHPCGGLYWHTASIPV